MRAPSNLRYPCRAICDTANREGYGTVADFMAIAAREFPEMIRDFREAAEEAKKEHPNLTGSRNLENNLVMIIFQMAGKRLPKILAEQISE